MIVFDTETTGLIENRAAPLDQQPRIIEVGAVKLDNDFNVIGELNFLVNPEIEISNIITKITGITNEVLSNRLPFINHVEVMQKFFLGEDTLIAHNMSFDASILRFALQRVGMEYKFPWPPYQLCTAELSADLFGKRLKLIELYEKIHNKKPTQNHRGLDDCYLVVECLPYLRKAAVI